MEVLGINQLGRASAPTAIHNSAERVDAQKCHPNTCVVELDRIMRWILYQENSEALIMWLFGASGSGKSVIAQTLAERCHTLGILLGSFFFSRSDPSRNHPGSLFATIAYQVVINFPDSRDIITRVPEQDPLVLTQSFEAQLTSLIIEPLKQLYLAGRCTGSSDPYLIIIDGLDECANPQVQVSILSSISKALQQCTFPLKFLISSRPELHLTAEFNSANPILTHLVLNNKFLPDNNDTIMPPPPPASQPPHSFPFSSSKPERRFSWSSTDSHVPLPISSSDHNIVRRASFSSTPTGPESITFRSNSEMYDEAPLIFPARQKFLKLFKTINGEKSTSFSKWGYTRSAGKKEKEKERPQTRANHQTKPSQHSKDSYPLISHTQDSTETFIGSAFERKIIDGESIRTRPDATERPRTKASHQTNPSQHSKDPYQGSGSRSTVPKPRPPFTSHAQDSTGTLGSAFERKINDVESTCTRSDTTYRLDEMRRLMTKNNLDY